MSRTDLISDGFTIIRNAAKAKKIETIIPHSKSLLKICGILKNEGYIENFKEIDLEKFKAIKVYLKYINKKSAFTTIKRVSKPSRRVYRKKTNLPYALQGYGITIISSSEGIFADKETRDKGVGGEIIGMVW